MHDKADPPSVKVTGLDVSPSRQQNGDNTSTPPAKVRSIFQNLKIILCEMRPVTVYTGTEAERDNGYFWTVLFVAIMLTQPIINVIVPYLLTLREDQAAVQRVMLQIAEIYPTFLDCYLDIGHMNVISQYQYVVSLVGIILFCLLLLFPTAWRY